MLVYIIALTLSGRKRSRFWSHCVCVSETPWDSAWMQAPCIDTCITSVLGWRWNLWTFRAYNQSESYFMNRIGQAFAKPWHSRQKLTSTCVHDTEIDGSKTKQSWENFLMYLLEACIRRFGVPHLFNLLGVRSWWWWCWVTNQPWAHNPKTLTRSGQ